MTEYIRPSNLPVEIFCKVCNTKDKAFMTLQETFDNTIIKQPCKKCGKFTDWCLKKIEVLKKSTIPHYPDRLLTDVRKRSVGKYY